MTLLWCLLFVLVIAALVLLGFWLDEILTNPDRKGSRWYRDLAGKRRPKR